MANTLDTFHGNLLTGEQSRMSIQIGVVQSISSKTMEATILIPANGSVLKNIPISGLFQFADNGNLQYPAIGSQVVLLKSPPLRPFILCSIVGRNAITAMRSDLLSDEQLFSTSKKSIIKQGIDGSVSDWSSNKNNLKVANDGIELFGNNLYFETHNTRRYTAELDGFNIVYEKTALTNSNEQYITVDEITEDNLEEMESTIVNRFSDLVSLISSSHIKATEHYDNMNLFDFRNQEDIDEYIKEVEGIFEDFAEDQQQRSVIFQTGASTKKKINSIQDIKSLKKSDLENFGSGSALYKISLEQGTTQTDIMIIFNDGRVMMPGLIPNPY